MNISIRNAKNPDAVTLCEAEKEWAKMPGYLVSQPSELRVESFARRIQELSENSRGLYIVAVDEGQKIVGHALLDPMGLSAIAHIVRLTIVVHRGFEGLGVGKLLMGRLVQWAKDTEEIEKIELLVRASNQPAIFLYKKFGFVEEGRLRSRIKISEGKYVDDVSMGLFI